MLYLLGELDCRDCEFAQRCVVRADELADWSAAIADYSVNGRSSSIVIQGTNCVDSCLGRAVSSGSVRVRNSDIVWMAITLPVGTPVSIH